MQSSGYIRLEENTTATSKNLYQAYCRWCEDNTEKPMSAKSFSGYLKENEKKYHIHYSTNIPSDNGKNARGFQGIHTQIRIDSYRWYGWKTDKKEFSKEAYMRIFSGKSRDYRFLKSMEDTFIRLYVWFLKLFYFLAEGSVADVKQPGYGQRKRADTPINEIASLSNHQIM